MEGFAVILLGFLVSYTFFSYLIRSLTVLIG